MNTDMRVVKRSLMSWGTGLDFTGRHSVGGASVVVVEDADHVGELLASDLVRSDSVVLVPAGGADIHEPVCRTFSYEGSLTEPGVEMSIGDDFYLEIQDHATSQYMSLLGPTLIRIVGGEDFATYLDDADAARTSGTFREFATHPAVQFADQSALGAGPGDDGPALRLFVARDGHISTSPGGLSLGTLGTPFDSVRAEWGRVNALATQPCSVCLGSVLDDEVRSSGLGERPWLGRYLLALGALRELRARTIEGAQVSGFGTRLLAGLPLPDDGAGTADRTGTAWPFLLWAGDDAYLIDPLPRRTLKLERRTAEVVDALLTFGAVEPATAHVPRAELLQVFDALVDNGVTLALDQETSLDPSGLVVATQG